ncbi:tRNA (guanine(10)-N2)-methyltransferase homolog [Liolophura sinensis]|uniref:tRNA (guanine(10)-N2)-methyltransferase homolog n=1 Tax=Liolophura sinensis TaxID=3198878 RepID=UPI003157FAAA
MAAPMRHASKTYLLQFAHEHIDFKLAELKAIAHLLRIPIRVDEAKYDKKNPFLVVDLPSEKDGRRIMGRSVLAKSLFELWATAGCFDDLHRELQMLPKDFVKPHLSEDLTYRIRVEAFNRSLSPAEKLERINALPEETLNFQGKVNLKSPDQSFHLLEFYEYEAQKSTKGPVALYFGRWVRFRKSDQCLP